MIDFSLRHTTSICAKLCLPALLVCTILQGCSGSHAWFSPDEEQQASEATLAWLGQRHGLIQVPELDRLLQKVTDRLSTAAVSASAQQYIEASAVRPQSSGSSSAAHLPASAPAWSVFVIDAPESNAYSLGSGIVVLTRNMFLELPSESALAAVISHEFAHQLLGHTSDALAQHGANEHRHTGSDSGQPRALRQESSPRSLFSLQQEIDADNLGARLLYLAGYDVNHALSSLTISSAQRSDSTAQQQGLARQAAENVSGESAQKPVGSWLQARAARLHALLHTFPQSPGTETSREFNRVQRIIGS